MTTGGRSGAPDEGGGGRRPAWAGGFRALLGGGIAVAVALVILAPVLDARDCPNYGGSGNASAFGDERYDLAFLLVLLAWLAAVLVEQALPVAWRNRGAGEVALRAVAAVLLALTVACCLAARLLTVCH
ncbi:hypothetical protein ABZS44_13445 [Micromonospora sediminicola]|uniref:hypothetical protein n=1 Tax=Micromonospora sediminicola TaxID=946078 RepID=UPI0033AF26D3